MPVPSSTPFLHYLSLSRPALSQFLLLQPVSIGLQPKIGLHPKIGLQSKIGLHPKIGLQPKIGLRPKIGLQPKIGLHPKTGLQPKIGLHQKIGLCRRRPIFLRARPIFVQTTSNSGEI